MDYNYIRCNTIAPDLNPYFICYFKQVIFFFTYFILLDLKLPETVNYTSVE